VRFRIDGMLHTVETLPHALRAAVTSRVKIMARLNIAERRLPQDGRIRSTVRGKDIDLRVSTMPTLYGESVVLRVLDRSSTRHDFAALGFSAEVLTGLRKTLGEPNGIVLVTGPTGSGKTTTLYAALSHINSPDKNILTIEDPIEYQIDGIGQMQVNPKINLTFANGLRSMVRQDPDVILVGEIRDLETAEIAIQAALTGHLVFSTLHTNDAPSAVTRLIDMGIEPFLVSSAVEAIVAQRLARLVCQRCREPYEPDEAELTELGIKLTSRRRIRIYRAKGCSACLETGYRDRTGIYEFLRMTEAIKGLVLKTSDANQIKKAAVTQGMKTLRDDGIRKVLEGRTTVGEVLRITQM
jgi:general secretion pathway protein E